MSTEKRKSPNCTWPWVITKSQYRGFKIKLCKNSAACLFNFAAYDVCLTVYCATNLPGRVISAKSS